MTGPEAALLTPQEGFFDYGGDLANIRAGSFEYGNLEFPLDFSTSTSTSQDGQAAKPSKGQRYRQKKKVGSVVSVRRGVSP